MNVFTKSIRKIMGWCPNAKALETGSQNIPANFEVYDRSGEKPGNNLSRMKRIGLLLTSLGSLVSVSSLALDLKDKVSSIMVGIGTVLFLIGIVLYIKG
ncbi:DUF1673 family protein [Methanosarcina sp. DH1]|jgi:hypothetical protein|uniref:DUF1673 family protein n=1 Tax=Methanosarcina sp. DH1 TaxID=2605695 RepID=UPI001E2FB235|nr:DUF1673 family protein [Methanosarcina sp. DH1]MCC4767969.1 DUF1673 family protein [Methanosarcina sp. DH1]